MVVELGKISWKGSACQVYIPKAVVCSLGLNRTLNKALILYFDEQSGLLCVWTDSDLEKTLQPQIEEARKKALMLINANR